MVRYQTFVSPIREILKERHTLDDAFEIVKYDAYEHRQIIPQMFSRTLDKKPLGEKWDQIEGFYPDGVYLILHHDDAYYVGFVLSHIVDNVPHISAIGIMEQYRRRGIGTFLIQKLAEHYAKMGYQELCIDLKHDRLGFANQCERLGFSKVESTIWSS